LCLRPFIDRHTIRIAFDFLARFASLYSFAIRLRLALRNAELDRERARARGVGLQLPKHPELDD
jgi:hypothetical protein